MKNYQAHPISPIAQFPTSQTRTIQIHELAIPDPDTIRITHVLYNAISGNLVSSHFGTRAKYNYAAASAWARRSPGYEELYRIPTIL